MAGVYNDYNKVDELIPVTRIGNWVEETALYEHTGLARGNRGDRTNDTSLRIVGSSASSASTSDWQSVSHVQHGPSTTVAAASTGQATPGRDQLRANDRLRRAEAIIQAEQARQNEEKQQELAHDLFGHKPPMNRTRVLKKPAGSPPSDATQPLSAMGVTFYTAMQGHIAMSPSTGISPFGKNTTFSKPIEEEMKAECR